MIIGAFILLSPLMGCFSTKEKTSREASLMEFMNGFFSENHKEKAQSHPVERKVEKKENNIREFRFKEKTKRVAKASKVAKVAKRRFKTVQNDSTTPAAGGAGNSTNSTQQQYPSYKEEWLMIQSTSFQSTDKFPPINLATGNQINIVTDKDNWRLNPMWDIQDKATRAFSNKFFFFRLSGLNLYYSTSQTDMNVLGAMNIQSINTVVQNIGQPTSEAGNMTYCFQVENFERENWNLCGLDFNSTKEWVCSIKQLLAIPDQTCVTAATDDTITPTVIQKTVTQPIIIIPMPSRHCNEGWNYNNAGSDWECDCKEGTEQSPIDVPSRTDTVDSPVKPLFEFEEVVAISTLNTVDGQLAANAPLKIALQDNALRIFHTKFGKTVTVDGALYYAQEISIHTPGEHKLQGKSFDLEVQILYFGQSIGDIGKQLMLCFPFETQPGVYNKFLDDIDIFNLPNPTTPTRDITNNIFIPKLFYNTQDDDLPVMKPFSFYTYQGSLTSPPCTENTVVYVAALPLQIGTTAFKLFQEAIRLPDMITAKGDVIASTTDPRSAREIQPLNGRPVFFYDHEKYCGPNAPKPVATHSGHYEKLLKTVVDYAFIGSDKPTGMPGAFHVSEREAKGILGTGAN